MPVFTPVFFDCEASDFDGYIIEVGWAFAPPGGGDIVTAEHLVRPSPKWRIRDAWSSRAEKLHGISLVHLREHGRPAEIVAGLINDELAGRELYSDDPTYDGRWLDQLFQAAAVKPAFGVSSTPVRILLENLARERNFDPVQLQRAWNEARRNRRHRADAAALVYAQLWSRIIENTGG